MHQAKKFVPIFDLKCTEGTNQRFFFIEMAEKNYITVKNWLFFTI